MKIDSIKVDTKRETFLGPKNMAVHFDPVDTARPLGASESGIPKQPAKHQSSPAKAPKKSNIKTFKRPIHDAVCWADNTLSNPAADTSSEDHKSGKETDVFSRTKERNRKEDNQPQAGETDKKSHSAKEYWAFGDENNDKKKEKPPPSGNRASSNNKNKRDDSQANQSLGIWQQ